MIQKIRYCFSTNKYKSTKIYMIIYAQQKILSKISVKVITDISLKMFEYMVNMLSRTSILTSL